MHDPIDMVGIRVLGSLIEKETTTPDTYPLTLNALTAACNQTSNRDPVLSLDEAVVAQSVEELSRRSLVREVRRTDSRAKRYRQTMSEAFSLHPAETAIMCVLMLRGAQTSGEIRGRAARLFEFASLEQVEITLQGLMTLSTPLVAQLPRQPGQKDVRYAHLLAGEPQVVTPEERPAEHASKADRVGALEQAVTALRSEVAELRTQLEEFRRQFQ